MVMGRALKELYGIRLVDIETRLNRADKLNVELLQWRRCAAPFMDDEDDTFMTSDLVRKAVLTQKLTYAHTQIMVYRPFLLTNFKLGGQKRGADRQRERLEANVKECLNAALYITNLVGGLYEQDPSFSAYWVSFRPEGAIHLLTELNSSSTTLDTQPSLSYSSMSYKTKARKKAATGPGVSVQLRNVGASSTWLHQEKSHLLKGAAGC